ncbi:MAG: hypothetical protein CM15mP81_05650 [Alphaproteobacteria bacterium]|nr:MAG: hypothetical protein CM15mP81_05650 [Alphaproteobacteria bacterium]
MPTLYQLNTYRFENNFEGIVNLITMKEWVWKSEDLGASWEIRDIRPELQNKANELRAQLIETAVEQDDEWTERFLEGEEPSVDDLHVLIRKGTLSMSFVPVLCGSAFKNKGVQPMLNAVIDYLPVLLDVPPYEGFKPGDISETET